MATAMNIPSFRVNDMSDLNEEMLNNFKNLNGPAVLEVALVDNNTPPMGDRVKFLSSFGEINFFGGFKGSEPYKVENVPLIWFFVSDY